MGFSPPAGDICLNNVCMSYFGKQERGVTKAKVYLTIISQKLPNLLILTDLCGPTSSDCQDITTVRALICCCCTQQTPFTLLRNRKFDFSLDSLTHEDNCF